MLRRGIEPIIATVILVAVALIIAVAVVGYLMGLFGGLTGGQPQITITNAVAKRPGGTGSLQLELYISNAGAGSDRLLRVEIIHGGATSIYYATGTFTGTAGMTATATTAATSMLVGGNSRGWLTLTTGFTAAAPGDTIIVKLYFEKSGVQTLNVVVSP